MSDWEIDDGVKAPQSAPGSDWEYVPEPVKTRAQRATEDDEATPLPGESDLSTPGSRRTFEASPDLVGQFKQMRAALDAQPSTVGRVANVAGNAALMGAGPAIAAAGSKVASLLPGQAPVDYNATRQANQAQLEDDRSALGTPATLAAETVGGLAPALLAPEVKAAQALSPVARGVTAGAGYGAAQALGESASKGDLGNVGKNMAIGAAAGGLTGGLMEGGMNRLAEHAGGEDDWLVHDILGNDAKTQANPTERKVLADDEADLKYTLMSDPALRRQVSKARGGDPGQLGKLADAIEGRKQAVIAPRDELYDHFDQESPNGGFRVGDLVDSVNARIKDFSHTGGAKQRKALENVRDSLQQFEGNDHVIDPKAEVTPGFSAVKFIDAKKRELANTTDPVARQTIQSDLDMLLQTHGRQVYNPDKIIPSAEARKVLTGLQGEVHDALGGFNERGAYKTARIVVGPIQDAFNAHLNTGDPELVGQIRDMNRKYSALRNMEDVVKQRLNRSTQQNLAVQKAPSSFRQMARNAGGLTGGALLAASGHPVMGAAMVGAAALPEVARGTDMALSRLIAASKAPGFKGDLSALARDAIQKGVPRSVAMQFAGSAVGGALHEAAP